MTADRHLPRDEHGTVRNPYTDPDGVMGGGLSQLRGSSSWVETDFESKSHPDMEQMIASADPKTAEHLGGKLKRAAKTIKKIGEDLKDRKGRVDWEGEGADSFDNWVTQMSSATLRLANMAEGTGTWMEHAAQTLREVQRDMPKYSESAKKITNDYNPAGPKNQVHLPQGKHGGDTLRGPSDGEYIAANKQLKDDHGEAVRQMKKLAQSYSQSSGAVHTAEKPTFPPMPKDLMPPEREPDHERAAPTGSPNGGPVHGGTASGGNPGRTLAGTGVPSPGSNEHSPKMHLAGTAPPQAPAVSPTAGPDAPSGQASSPAVGAPPGPAGGVAAPPHQPAAGVGKVPQPSGAVRPGGTATPRGVSDPSTGAGNGMGRPPVATGQSGPRAGSPRTVRAPGDHGNGIFGGRPSTTGQSNGAIPRGTVVGGERSATGSGALGSGHGAGAVGPGTGSSRQLASQQGGVVGTPEGRQVPGGRQFTQGGAGLVRNTGESSQSTNDRSTGGGRARNDGAREGGQQDRRHGQQNREYPVEGEETWIPRNERVVPPVIE